MGKRGEKWYTSRGMRFLLIILMFYPLMTLVDYEKTLDAASFSLKLLLQMLPILSLVFMLMFLANMLVSPQWIKANLGRSSGLKGWVVACIAGILSVGPIYVWFGFLQEMRAKGMRPALISVFLYNRSIKLPILPLIIHYFGFMFTTILSIYLLIFSLLGGLIIERLLPDNLENNS